MWKQCDYCPLDDHIRHVGCEWRLNKGWSVCGLWNYNMQKLHFQSQATSVQANLWYTKNSVMDKETIELWSSRRALRLPWSLHSANHALKHTHIHNNYWEKHQVLVSIITTQSYWLWVGEKFDQLVWELCFIFQLPLRYAGITGNDGHLSLNVTIMWLKKHLNIWNGQLLTPHLDWVICHFSRRQSHHQHSSNTWSPNLTTLKLRFTLDILSVIALNRRVSEVSSESSVHVEHSFRSKCKRTNVPLLTTLQETQSLAFFRHTTQFWFLHFLWKSKKLVHSTSLLTICFISACTGSSVASYISLRLDNISRQTAYQDGWGFVVVTN